MATAAETLAAIRETNTKADSLIVLTGEIKQRLDDALSGVALPAAVQADIDAIFAETNAQAGEITDAINANTPPTP